MSTSWQAINWTNDGIVYWRIYASLSLNELKEQNQSCINNTVVKMVNFIYLFVCFWGLKNMVDIYNL